MARVLSPQIQKLEEFQPILREQESVGFVGLALDPIITLRTPVVILQPAPKPRPILKLPVVFAREHQPTEALPAPVTFRLWAQ
jgi:hypothetical protein